MRKFGKAISIILCGTILLTGCGDNRFTQDGGIIGGLKQSPYTTFSDIKNSGELVVLYQTNDSDIPGKDSVPEAVFILEDGKVYGDHVPKTTFGEYSKMTDEEIKQCVLTNGEKNTFSYANNEDYEIVIYTDSTGNTTQYESLLVKDCDDLYIYGLMQFYSHSSAYATVYESNYIGFNMTVDEDWDWYGILWYREQEDLILALDEPTEKGIMVDPEEEFESNAYKEGM